MKTKLLVLIPVLLLACGCSNPEVSSSSSNSQQSEVSASSSTPSSVDSSEVSIEVSSTESEVSSSEATTSLETDSSSTVESSAASETKREQLTTTYLEGTLYGEEDFISKIRSLPSRLEIPDDAIYVSPSGSDSNDGTINSPLLTINKAIGNANTKIKNNQNGFIVCREGVYTEQVTFYARGGTKDHYLTLTSYPGEEVKISGTSYQGNIHMGTANYVIIENITICDNVSSSIEPVALKMDQTNSHIIFRNNTITNVKTENPQKKAAYLVYINGTKAGAPIENVLIYNNDIHDCNTGWSEAIEVVANCDKVNVIKNRVNSTGNIGIDIGGNFGYCSTPADDQARNVVVRGNTVSNCKSIIATSYGIYVDGAHDVLIENNTSFNNQGGIEIGSERFVEGYPVQNIVIRNNLVYNNEEHGITVGGYDPNENTGTVKNVKIYNNTVANNGGEYDGQFTYSMVDNIELFNNIFYISKDQVLVDGYLDASYSTNLQFHDNLYYASVSADNARFCPAGNDVDGFEAWKTYSGENGIYMDPSFVNASSNDYHLTSNSPALDKGFTCDYGPYDLDGYTRINNILDYGCYEFFKE